MMGLCHRACQHLEGVKVTLFNAFFKTEPGIKITIKFQKHMPKYIQTFEVSQIRIKEDEYGVYGK